MGLGTRLVRFLLFCFISWAYAAFRKGGSNFQRRRNVFKIGGADPVKLPTGGGGGGGGGSPLTTGGGGGAVHFWHTENTLSLIIHGFANRYSITERRNEVDVDVIW